MLLHIVLGKIEVQMQIDFKMLQVPLNAVTSLGLL